MSGELESELVLQGLINDLWDRTSQLFVVVLHNREIVRLKESPDYLTNVIATRSTYSGYKHMRKHCYESWGKTSSFAYRWRAKGSTEME